MSETNLRAAIAGLPSVVAVRGFEPPRTDRSALWTAFNIARSAARKGFLDEKRLNRALGIAMRSGETHIDRYHTTPERCDCPDWRYRIRYTGGNCKGQLCLALKELAA